MDGHGAQHIKHKQAENQQKTLLKIALVLPSILNQFAQEYYRTNDSHGRKDVGNEQNPKDLTSERLEECADER